MKLGRAYELWTAEAERLEAAEQAARAAYSEALYALEAAKEASHRHGRFQSDPLAWANGETLGDREDKYRSVKCEKCGWEGVTPSGVCGECGGPESINVLSIYQSV